MVLQQRYGGKLLATLAVITTLFLTGCSSLEKEPELKVVTKVEKLRVPITARPKPVQLNDVKIYVVNEANFDDFIKRFKEENGQVAYVALSMRDYENLALNVAELRRYINQQTQVIIYYEDAMKEEEKEVNEAEGNTN